MFNKINQKKRFFKKSNLKLFILTIIFINTLPIHAYAGPGVAIGAIIVLFTVLFAFFGSLIIRIFNLIKKIISILFSKPLKNKNNTPKNKKSKKK